MNLLGSAGTGAYLGIGDSSDTSIPHASPLYLLPAVALLCAPFPFEMLDCGLESPRTSIVAGHRGENTTDEVRTVARRPHAAHGIVSAGRRERSSLSACLSATDCVGAHLQRAAMPTQRSMPSWHRGSEAALGAEGRRRRRRCELSLRVAKKCASCASVDASLSMGCTFGA